MRIGTIHLRMDQLDLHHLHLHLAVHQINPLTLVDQLYRLVSWNILAVHTNIKLISNVHNSCHDGIQIIIED